jgi:hypothetical protein
MNQFVNCWSGVTLGCDGVQGNQEGKTERPAIFSRGLLSCYKWFNEKVIRKNHSALS